MKQNNNTEKDIIDKLLNLNENPDSSISSLAVALKGARKIIGRDIETGELSNKSSIFLNLGDGTFLSNQFIGITSYLIIVDLIGTIFNKKSSKRTNEPFVNALKQFTKLKGEEIEVLKNLRNSLAHTLSLGNDSAIFELDLSSDTRKIIDLAKIQYHVENRLNGKNKDNFNTIYVNNFCDLVEKIYKELISLNEKNELEIVSKFKNKDSVKINDIKALFFIIK